MLKNKKTIILCLTFLIAAGIDFGVNKPEKVQAAYNDSCDMIYKHTDTKVKNETTSLPSQSCDYNTGLDSEKQISTSKASYKDKLNNSNSLLPTDSNKSTTEIDNIEEILKNQLKELGKSNDNLNSTDDKNVNIDELSKEQDLLKQKLSSN
jgi:hypothetical protein